MIVNTICISLTVNHSSKQLEFSGNSYITFHMVTLYVFNVIRYFFQIINAFLISYIILQVTFNIILIFDYENPDDICYHYSFSPLYFRNIALYTENANARNALNFSYSSSSKNTCSTDLQSVSRRPSLVLQSMK